MTQNRIATVGYEGRDVEDFVATLAAGGIRRLVDIRELPLSRKRGFSKSALRDALSRSGIEYAHLRALGAPRARRGTRFVRAAASPSSASPTRATCARTATRSRT